MSAVLVVDDEAGMRVTLTDILEDAGYEVGSADNGSTALDALRHDHYDVVVMDMRMPIMDGVTALQEIGEPPPNVIMMTAYAVEEQLRIAVESKVFAVVHKPFAVPYLLRLVEDAAARVP
jgi:CheY-like chemotaxis protein